ncbi:MAG: hypothetical protein RL322_2186 [Pseudomonadota bacterium]|jgi:ribonucleotide reductase alpha subunit
MTGPIEQSFNRDTFRRLPPQAICDEVLRERYLKQGEQTIGDLFDRVARALASVEPAEIRAELERRFRANLEAGAIGAGRIMSGAGTVSQATLVNCFVQPVGDCIQGFDAAGFPGIAPALREAAETLRRGGGVGYDFSRIRPRGARAYDVHTRAAGPCHYIDRFDQSCASIERSGTRRGAQMGVLRIDHPDILSFIHAKRRPGRWRTFNVSVGVTDAFIEAVHQRASWELVHRAEPGPAQRRGGARQHPDGRWIYRSLSARALWKAIMRAAYDCSEPGVLFLDRIETDNNLRAIETLSATNPCVTAETWVMTSEGARSVAELLGKPFEARVNGLPFRSSSRGFFSSGIEPVIELRTVEGHALRLTPAHRVCRVQTLWGRGPTRVWTPASCLKPGDRVLLNDHQAGGVEPRTDALSAILQRSLLKATIKSVEPCGEAPVYDVTICHVHAFAANGLLVHNCGEQPLPPYGCCDLGPMILPRFVRHPFDHGGPATFDFERFRQGVSLQVRALDNVLDLSPWPLEQHQREAQAKRRIGVGFTGLGDALIMLGLRYDSSEGRAMARRIAQSMRDTAYRSSVALAAEKGPYPLFDANAVLAEGTFASRLPKPIRQAIQTYGLRNSHLLSIAPTGSVSLAFADNVSAGIEPAYAWTYLRRRTEVNGTERTDRVEDHAYRVYCSLGGDPARLPEPFVSALEISPEDHIAMLEVIQPLIDGSISKTVNVAADTPFSQFQSLYMRAWSAGLKGITTHRPTVTRGSVLACIGMP